MAGYLFLSRILLKVPKGTGCVCGGGGGEEGESAGAREPGSPKIFAAEPGTPSFRCLKP